MQSSLCASARRSANAFRAASGLLVAAWTLVGVLSLAGVGSADTPALAARVAQVDAHAFPSIDVVVGVFAPDGKAVPGLTKDAFAFDEGGKPAPAQAVRVEDAPLAVGLALDTSERTRSVAQGLNRAASDFLRSLAYADRTALVTFGDSATLVHQLTGDRPSVLEAMKSVRTGGGAALYDGMYQAIDEAGGAQARHLVVVVTAGRDLNADGSAPQSAYSAKNVVKRARDRQVSLWAIGLGRGVDQSLLGRMADLTGGHAYFPASARDLQATFENLLSDVHLQYRVTYRSPAEKPDGAERKATLHVSASGQRGAGAFSYSAPAPEPSPSPGSAGGQGTGATVASAQGKADPFARAHVLYEQPREDDIHLAVKFYRDGEPQPAQPAHFDPAWGVPPPWLKPGKYICEVFHNETKDPLFSFSMVVKPGVCLKVTLRGRVSPDHPEHVTLAEVVCQ